MPRPAPDRDAPPPEVKLRAYNVYRGAPDPRWARLPQRVHTAELLPRTTIAAVVSSTVQSVRFDVDGVMRVDSTAPFRWSEDDSGNAVPWSLGAGKHHVEAVGYPTPDGSGTPLASASTTLEISDEGSDPSPDEGGHAQFRFWITRSGKYVTRAPSGSFVDAAGEVVLDADDVVLEEREEEQGRFVSRREGLDDVEFAFQILLPEGYDPSTKYPLVLFLHHGWHVFRGTDNDGRMLTECPIFAGPRSLTRSANRNRFPAIFLVPQMVGKENVGGVEHEWAAFTNLDTESGHFESAEMPSKSTAFTLKVLDDLLEGTLPIAGERVGLDDARLYVTGHSMGGLGTWDLLARRPEIWAAAAPMAGYADPSTAGQLAGVPIWAFHHEADCYNTIRGTTAMVKRIHDAARRGGLGDELRFTRLDFDTQGKCDQAHFRTPAAAWNESDELPVWMFSQARPSPAY